MTNRDDQSGKGKGQDRRPTNLTASISQRLLNLARARHDEFQNVLIRYALERLIYRLGTSDHASEFIIKGALLFSLWMPIPHRATRDLDVLGYGSPDAGRLENIFRELCRMEGDDGLRLEDVSVRATPIREDQEYGGIRVQLLALLGNARIPLQVDVGFGDAITPAPAEVAFPTLLDMPAPTVRVYPRETVVAEKFEAMVRLGMANTRMKDFYDLWILASQFAFEGALLGAALSATFARRATPLPTEIPLALTPEFTGDTVKQTQWEAFLRKGHLADTQPQTLADVATLIQAFLLPPTHAEATAARWPPGGLWQPQDTVTPSAPTGL